MEGEVEAWRRNLHGGFSGFAFTDMWPGGEAKYPRTQNRKMLDGDDAGGDGLCSAQGDGAVVMVLCRGGWRIKGGGRI